MEKKTRSFIALELPGEVINEIARIQKLIEKENLFKGKFTTTDNLHLTLKFLGEIDDERLETVKKRLESVKIEKSKAELGGAGVFSKDNIKIIWIKLNGQGVLELQNKIDEVLKDLFSPEQRFMSHITIARVKSVDNKQELLGFLEKITPKKLPFETDRFFLKKSELHSAGPVYNNIREYILTQ